MQRASRLRQVAYTTLAVGGGGLAWYAYSRPSLKPTTGETFDLRVRVRGPDGKAAMSTRTIPLMSTAEVDAKIREHAIGADSDRGSIRWKYRTASMAANDGIEDAHAQAIIERNTSPNAPPGDLLFFSVMDGHGGPHTSSVLSKALIPAVAMEMSSLIAAPPPKPSTASYIKSLVSAPSPTSPSYSFDSDPFYVGGAIKTAFSKLDSLIVNAPIQLLETIQKETPNEPPHQHPMALATIQPALSGSCALLAMLDTSRQDLYVACTGDSRAVAGYWHEPSDGQPGYWRAEVLTEDQTGRNPNELKRLQSEHPASENATVVRNGRILGGLEPSRAFGDATYKWPKEIHQKLVNNLLPPGTSYRSLRPNYNTPPYVTCQPVITHRKLDFLPNPSTSLPPDTNATMKFIVLATDGLWDQLSSSEVVSLVGGYLQGLKGSVPKNTLASTVRVADGAEGIDGKKQKSGKGVAGDGESWAFEDEHVGAHLIRNAFGGAQKEQLARMVSIPVPLARSFRDDITVTVVWWEEAQHGDAKQSDEAIRAKL